jgi:hypothetical protein
MLRLETFLLTLLQADNMITLAIDYGASNVGIALVRNTEAGNEPLFAGTVILDARKLKEKVETRAGIRGLRRTRKTGFPCPRP